MIFFLKSLVVLYYFRNAEMSHQFLEDIPIVSENEDFLNRSTFAETIAKSITQNKSDHGFVMSLTGKWGVGKSSVVNLINKQLGTLDPTLKIINFQCWRIRGEDSLVLNFFQTLKQEFKNSQIDDQDIDELFYGIAESLIQVCPVLPLSRKILDPIKRRLNAKYSVDGCYTKLRELCQNRKTRILIVLDDIDRLSEDETLLLFQMIKSVASLPYITFLLVYDRELIERVCCKAYPSEGSHYLEKIVQLTIEIPEPTVSQLRKYFIEKLSQVLELDESEKNRLRLSLLENISPIFTSFRDVIRLINAFSVKWPIVKNDVDFVDFLALEIIHMKSIVAYKNIRDNQFLLCQTVSIGEQVKFNSLLNKFNHTFGQEDAIVLDLLRYLFPRYSNKNLLNDVNYGFDESAEKDRKLRVLRYFDNYFRFEISAAVIPMRDIRKVIENSENSEYLINHFKQEAKHTYFDKLTGLASYLNELYLHTELFSSQQAKTFLLTLAQHGQILFNTPDEVIDFYKGPDNTIRFVNLFSRLIKEQQLDEFLPILFKEAYLPLLRDLFDEVKRDKSIDSLMMDTLAEIMVNRIIEAQKADTLLLLHNSFNLIFF